MLWPHGQQRELLWFLASVVPEPLELSQEMFVSFAPFQASFSSLVSTTLQDKSTCCIGALELPEAHRDTHSFLGFTFVIVDQNELSRFLYLSSCLTTLVGYCDFEELCEIFSLSILGGETEHWENPEKSQKRPNILGPWGSRTWCLGERPAAVMSARFCSKRYELSYFCSNTNQLRTVWSECVGESPELAGERQASAVDEVHLAVATTTIKSQAAPFWLEGGAPTPVCFQRCLCLTCLRHWRLLYPPVSAIPFTFTAWHNYK